MHPKPHKDRRLRAEGLPELVYKYAGVVTINGSRSENPRSPHYTDREHIPIGGAPQSAPLPGGHDVVPSRA